MLAWLAPLVGAGYLLYRAASAPSAADPALAELRLAYAWGDLSREAFEKRREKLGREE